MPASATSATRTRSRKPRRSCSSAPRDPAVIDGDAFWVERRIVSRALLDKGDAKTAYKLAATHSAETSADIAEAEFHAGWYALEFLGDPNTARKHFLEIERVSEMPLSQSRAEYWLGRAAERAGDRNAAIAHYKNAGRFPTTFYGQIALSRLGVKELPIAPAPRIDAAAKKRFESHELVQVINKLDALNRGDRNSIFLRVLADRLTDPAEIALLCEMAEEEGGHRSPFSSASRRPTGTWRSHSSAFPTSAIPSSAKTGAVEKPMVYAIARQESSVQSRSRQQRRRARPAPAHAGDGEGHGEVGRRHLLAGPAHLRPGLQRPARRRLPRQAAGELRRLVHHDVRRLQCRAEPRHGLDQAVRRSARPECRRVNWIERIPFTETRNYVQRVMENYQVYRARLGAKALTIESDLKRGG